MQTRSKLNECSILLIGKFGSLQEKNNYVIVTHDSDFNDLNALFGFPPKIIWIRTGNIRPKELADLILQYEPEIAKFISEDIYGCFEIFSIP